MYNIEADKKERRKVVIFAGATVALILALIVAIVVVATNKSTRNVGGNDNTSFTISEKSDAKVDPLGEETKEEKTSNSSKATIGTVTTKSTPAATTSTVTNMPDTGPADLMLLAASMGGLTTAGVAIAMKKRA